MPYSGASYAKSMAKAVTAKPKQRKKKKAAPAKKPKRMKY